MLFNTEWACLIFSIFKIKVNFWRVGVVGVSLKKTDRHKNGHA